MGTWNQAVQQMANFYQNNVHTYQGTTSKPRLGRKQYSCSLLGWNVMDDCSGFTSACLQLFGAFSKSDIPTSGSFASTSNAIANKLRRAGFSPYAFNINALQPFDIVAKNGHVEIYAGSSGSSRRSYSWGNIHDRSHGGLPSYYCKDNYVLIWRNSGVSIDTPLVFEDSLQNSMTFGYQSSQSSGSFWNFSNSDESTDYPVHSEYDTFTGTGLNIFQNPEENSISLASLNIVDTSSISDEHTRIYSTNDASIILDELAIPADEMQSWMDMGTEQTIDTSVNTKSTSN